MTRTAEQPATGGRRALVTGGAGFIGSHLVDTLLARGDSVTVVDDLSTGTLDNLPPATPSAKAGGRLRVIRSTVSDALESELTDEPPFDEIYHLAASVGVMRILERPAESIETNILETSALLRYARGHHDGETPRIMIASSSEVYGLGGGGRSLSENDDCTYGPTTAHRWSYGYSKAVDEFLGLAYHREHGLPVVMVRFFNIVGPRQSDRYGMVVPRFVRAALEGEDLTVFGDGSQVRTFCDVRDAVHVLPALARSPAASGSVVNLGSDRPISVFELAQKVIECLNSASAVRTIPYHEAYGAGFQDLPHRCPDLSRARDLCGFAPKRALGETLRDIAGSLGGEAEGSKARTGSVPRP